MSAALMSTSIGETDDQLSAHIVPVHEARESVMHAQDSSGALNT